MSMQKDTLFLGTRCPNFVSEVHRVMNTAQMQKAMMHHLPLFDYVSRHTGMEIRQPSEVALLYAALETKVRHL